MAKADPEIVKALDRMAQERFNLEAIRQGHEDAQKVQEAELRAQFADHMAPIIEQIDKLDSEIWQLITDNRASLIAEGKQSFVIASATFQFRRLNVKIVPVDIEGIMNVARRFSLVGDIADPPSRKWKFNKQRFFNWLEAHAYMRPKFAKYLEEVGGGQSLSVKPNTGHVVFHDANRLTPVPFTINKS